MKKIFYVLGLVLALASCDKKASYESKTLDNGADSLSYSFGYSFASRLASDTILTDTIQMDAFMKGIYQAMNQEDGAMTEEARQTAIEAFVKVIQEQMRAEQENDPQIAPDASGFGAAGKAFLAENESKEGVITLESGMQYEILTEGTGTISPSAESTVSVHYTGMLTDGSVFDSSVERGEPATFPVNGVIKGWTEALQLMKTGDKWRLFIPSELAYGERGAGRDIPPYSVLIFDVELLEIK